MIRGKCGTPYSHNHGITGTLVKVNRVGQSQLGVTWLSVHPKTRLAVRVGSLWCTLEGSAQWDRGKELMAFIDSNRIKSLYQHETKLRFFSFLVQFCVAEPGTRSQKSGKSWEKSADTRWMFREKPPSASAAKITKVWKRTTFSYCGGCIKIRRAHKDWKLDIHLACLSPSFFFHFLALELTTV